MMSSIQFTRCEPQSSSTLAPFEASCLRVSRDTEGCEPLWDFERAYSLRGWLYVTSQSVCP